FSEVHGPNACEKRKKASYEPSPRSGVSEERRWLVVAKNCGALPRRRHAGFIRASVTLSCKHRAKQMAVLDNPARRQSPAIIQLHADGCGRQLRRFERRHRGRVF